MLKVSHLEVGALASYIRLAEGRGVVFPIGVERYRNGAYGQHWLEVARSWDARERVIDVGCGYSDLPALLARRGCEVWGADDFGLKSGDPYWLRGNDPHELTKQFPAVRYVFERLGDSPSSFPQDYFDVVISNQALHVAPPPHAPIWRDMLRVMRKSSGSEILVSMICNFCTDGSPDQAYARLEAARAMEARLLGRMARGEKGSLEEFEEEQAAAGQSFHRFSPALYAAYVATALDAAPFAMPVDLLAENFCTRVDALIEPASIGFNNARFSGNPEEARTFRYGRYAPLLMRLTWGDAPVRHGAARAELLAGWRASGVRIEEPAASGQVIMQPAGVPGFVTLVESTDDSTHMITREMGTPADVEGWVEVLAHPNGRPFLGIWMRGPEGTSDVLEVFFDLNKGIVTEKGRHGSGTLRSARIEPVGGGWYACSVRGTPSVIPGTARASLLVRNSPTNSSRYAGDGVSGLHLALKSVS